MLSCSVVSKSLQHHGLESSRPLCLWDFPARTLEWVAIPFSGGLPHPGIDEDNRVRRQSHQKCLNPRVLNDAKNKMNYFRISNFQSGGILLTSSPLVMWEDFFLFVFYIFTNGGKKVVVFPSKQRPGRLQNIISSRGQSLPSHYKERPNSKVEGARLSVGDQQKQACARSHHSNITTHRSDPTLLSIDVPPLMHRTRKDRIKYF